MSGIDKILEQFKKLEDLIGYSNPLYSQFMDIYSDMYDAIEEVKNQANDSNNNYIEFTDNKPTVEMLMKMNIISVGNPVAFINEDHVSGRNGYVREVGALDRFTIPQHYNHKGLPTKAWKFWESIKKCKVAYMHTDMNSSAKNPLIIHIHYGDVKEEERYEK